MENILPIIEQIDSSQDVVELKFFKITINEALVLVGESSRVRHLNLPSKAKYTRKIKEVNRKMLKFCRIGEQLIQSRHQLESSVNLVDNESSDSVDGLSKRMDGLSVPVFRDRCSVPKLDKVLVGLDRPLVKLKKKLISDPVDSLLVSAPPGCGKTMLVTQLCHDKDIKGHFRHIFFTFVSSTPNFRVIVHNLFHDSGYQELTFENDSQATVALRELLEELIKDGPILLVLDDVWQEADSLLNKFRIKLPGYKILVTSRFNLPSFDFTYSLEPLIYEHAKSLLIQCASLPRHTSHAVYEYHLLLQKILKRCCGFPIVIEVVGCSLKGQSLDSWKRQVESWSVGKTILDNPLVLERMQPSFIALEPHLKECFMDMGSFLEDQKISASVLVDIWMELYGKGRSSSILYVKYLDDLASQNLLKITPLGENELVDGFYNEFIVTQHDILRELAIHQIELEAIPERKRLNLVIRGDNYPDWCLNQRKPIINARLLSISTDYFFSSTWEEIDLFSFSNVEALVLNLSSSNYALPSFITKMNKLRVVIIINHGDSVKLTNFSCLSSLPNLKRIRLEKVSISSLDILQLQFGSLEKLSLVMCSFGKIFYDTEEIDVSKALPSLQEIDIDFCYDLYELPYWISEALSLVKLSIINCNNLCVLPEAIGNLSKLETLRLSSCINLSELPETIARLSNLQFLDISHCLGLRKLPLEIGKLQKLKKISMKKCRRCELPDSVKNLEDLEVKCDEETELVLWRRLQPQMRNLRVHVY